MNKRFQQTSGKQNRSWRCAVRWNSEETAATQATKEMTCSREYQGASRLRQQLSQSGEEDGGGEWGGRGDSELPTPSPHPRTEPPGSTDKHKDRQASGGSSLKEQSQLWQQEMRDGLWRFLMWILLSRSKPSPSGHFWGEPKPHTHTHTELYLEFLLKGEVGKSRYRLYIQIFSRQ